MTLWTLIEDTCEFAGDYTIVFDTADDDLDNERYTQWRMSASRMGMCGLCIA